MPAKLLAGRAIRRAHWLSFGSPARGLPIQSLDVASSTKLKILKLGLRRIAINQHPNTLQKSVELLVMRKAKGKLDLRKIRPTKCYSILEIAVTLSVDWHKRESAPARMRILVKRILKKYG